MNRFKLRLSTPALRSARPRADGFTLIEVMIVVVVVAILAAIAVPSYTQYVTRSRLTEAHGTLATFRLRMEQSYQDNGNFGASGCSVPMISTSFFTYSCSLTASGQGFTATATGIGSIAGHSFTIDEQGRKLTTAFPGAGSASCWLVRTGICV
jgi:type IV pilus assembly protein PilE